jgi:hypothetical protein
MEADDGGERTTRPGQLGRRRDLIVYSIAGAGLVALGFVWKGALSMILAPFWMLLVVWIVPQRLERFLRGGFE